MIKIIDRIILVGTSHVAQNSVKEIEQIIEQYKPAVVGIELDTDRFRSLMSEKKEDKKKSDYKVIKDLGVFGYLFAQLAGYVQKKVGKKINIDPGVDMKGAYLKARENKIPVSLIDINIKITLRKLSKLSFFKKLSLVSNLFFKSFKKEYKDLLNFDLKNVPDDEVVQKMIGVLKKETPVLYNILIEDRNIHMSKKLLNLMDNHEGYIIGVVGAGHVEGMSNYIKKNLDQRGDFPQFTYSFNVNLEDLNKEI